MNIATQTESVRLQTLAPSGRFAIIVPTLNAASTWRSFLHGIDAQQIAPDQVLIVDSSSIDNTPELARKAGFQVISIDRKDFNHGGTRQWAVQFAGDAEVLVFLTQDAILADGDSIHNLLAAFDDPDVGAAYGRQLPRAGAGPIEAHGRFFNYPDHDEVRSLESRRTLGFKAVFISNAFAAYRRSALDAVGGFPSNVILGEDSVTAARLLTSGWKIAYVASASVYHSHEYSVWQEFQRYFDVGVLHAQESWLVEQFGGTSSEGKRFVFSEIRHLWPKHLLMIPSALVRTAGKLAGYKLGRHEAKLSLEWKRMLSMHRGFWK